MRWEPAPSEWPGASRAGSAKNGPWKLHFAGEAIQGARPDWLRRVRPSRVMLNGSTLFHGWQLGTAAVLKPLRLTSVARLWNRGLLHRQHSLVLGVNKRRCGPWASRWRAPLEGYWHPGHPQLTSLISASASQHS